MKHRRVERRCPDPVALSELEVLHQAVEVTRDLARAMLDARVIATGFNADPMPEFVRDLFRLWHVPGELIDAARFRGVYWETVWGGWVWRAHPDRSLEVLARDSPNLVFPF